MIYCGKRIMSNKDKTKRFAIIYMLDELQGDGNLGLAPAAISRGGKLYYDGQVWFPYTTKEDIARYNAIMDVFGGHINVRCEPLFDSRGNIIRFEFVE